MGNRDDLQAATAKLIRSQRFGSISARDIAREAGSSTAAINYHFRTLDSLLLGSLLEAMGELGADIEHAIDLAGQAGLDARGRQKAFWGAVIQSVEKNRPIWLANFEALLEAESRPELRDLLAESTRFGAGEIGATLYGAGAGSPVQGRLANALMVGLVAQLLTDADAAPTADQIADWLTGSVG